MADQHVNARRHSLQVEEGYTDPHDPLFLRTYVHDKGRTELRPSTVSRIILHSLERVLLDPVSPVGELLLDNFKTREDYLEQVVNNPEQLHKAQLFPHHSDLTKSLDVQTMRSSAKAAMEKQPRQLSTPDGEAAAIAQAHDVLHGLRGTISRLLTAEADGIEALSLMLGHVSGR